MRGEAKGVDMVLYGSSQAYSSEEYHTSVVGSSLHECGGAGRWVAAGVQYAIPGPVVINCFGGLTNVDA